MDAIVVDLRDPKEKLKVIKKIYAEYSEEDAIQILEMLGLPQIHLV